jgi:hypothetical protein
MTMVLLVEKERMRKLPSTRDSYDSESVLETKVESLVPST